MLSKEDYEYLKNLKYLGIKVNPLNMTSAWYGSDDVVIRVARILVGNGVLLNPYILIDYFERPYKWEQPILGLIKEYEGVSPLP